MIIPYFNSYEGKEDFSLLDRLIPEMPGITVWALEGLRQLKTAGRLLSPKAGEDILQDFVNLSSPMHAFIDDCCEIDPENKVIRTDFQTAFKRWANKNGHVYGSAADIGKKLRAAVPRIKTSSRRETYGRVRWYDGIGLNTETALDIQNV